MPGIKRNRSLMKLRWDTRQAFLRYKVRDMSDDGTYVCSPMTYRGRNDKIVPLAGHCQKYRGQACCPSTTSSSNETSESSVKRRKFFDCEDGRSRGRSKAALVGDGVNMEVKAANLLDILNGSWLYCAGTSGGGNCLYNCQVTPTGSLTEWTCTYRPAWAPRIGRLGKSVSHGSHSSPLELALELKTRGAIWPSDSSAEEDVQEFHGGALLFSKISTDQERYREYSIASTLVSVKYSTQQVDYTYMSLEGVQSFLSTSIGSLSRLATVTFS
ncbi:6388_t:CDS:2 [Acaulospora colombiana]|uniref:6388_t:CDS:1 n=1 Tax=Acaulospora colombiana TaxID=27376 RepID=A0ACA9NNV2_9GLOM|nr:6388_t:CDS:2 [Acaulospora colombiana]